MVEMKNNCDSCVHKHVCKYVDVFQKSMDDIIKVSNDHFEAYDFSGLVDLNIRCRQYVMAPYQEVKSKRNNGTPLEFYYSDIHKVDLEKMGKHSFEFPRPDFMKTSADLQEDVK